MNVLYLTLDMDLGGLQRIVSLLISNLDSTRFTAHLCCLGRGGVFSDSLINRGIDTQILTRRPGKFDRTMYRELVHFIRTREIDVIHSQNGCMLYAVAAGRLGGVKGIVHTDHGRLVPDRFGAKVEDRVCSYLVNDVIGVSAELTEYLRSEVKIPRRKLRTILNGVDTKKFQPTTAEGKNQARREFGLNTQARIIGTVCRLDHVKNIDLVIRSLPEIRAKWPDLQFVIVGDGPNEEDLRRTVRTLDLENVVHFAGMVGDVDKLLPALDVYVNASISEGTCMAILEAMSCGIPVVASNVGGNPKLVDEGCGKLFLSGDLSGLRDALLSVLDLENQRARMGEHAREKVCREFSLAAMVDTYQDLYASYIR